MSRHFIDISNHQSSIRIRDVPTDAVIVKATEGKGWRDRSMPGFVAQARAADKPVGFYHFVSQGNTPQAEADNFLGYTDGHRRDNDVLVLDWEPLGSNPGNRNVDWARRFLEHMTARAGNPVWTYMNLSTANAANWKPVTARWPKLWLAHYPGNNKATGYNPAGSRGHLDGANEWQLAAWQFTDGGRLSGYSGALDLNELYTPWWNERPADPFVPVSGIIIPTIHENDPKVWIDTPNSVKRSGGWGCICMKLTIPFVDEEMRRRGIVRKGVDYFQFGYAPYGPNSKDTHGMGGVVDVVQGITLEERRVWAMFGVMMAPRVNEQGYRNTASSPRHGHGGWFGCNHRTKSLAKQVEDMMDGRNGLMSNLRVNWEKPLRTWQDALRETVTITVPAIPPKEDDPMPELHTIRTTFNHPGPQTDDPDSAYSRIFESSKGEPEAVPAVPGPALYDTKAQIHAPTGVRIKWRYAWFDEDWHRTMEVITPRTTEGHPTHVDADAKGRCPSPLFLDIWADKPCEITVEQQTLYWPI